jgi:hypothetical protein
VNKGRRSLLEARETRVVSARENVAKQDRLAEKRWRDGDQIEADRQSFIEDKACPNVYLARISIEGMRPMTSGVFTPTQETNRRFSRDK